MAAAGEEVIGGDGAAEVATTNAAAGAGAGLTSSTRRTIVPAALLERDEASQQVERICQFALLRDKVGLKAYIIAGRSRFEFSWERDHRGLLSRCSDSRSADMSDGEGLTAIERLLLADQLGAAAWLYRIAPRINDYVRGAALCGLDDLVEQLISESDSLLTQRHDMRVLCPAVEGAAHGGHKALVHRLLAEGADLSSAVTGATLGGQVALVWQLLLMGAYPPYAALALDRFYALTALRRSTYLKEACEQCAVTTPIALLQFILEHPCPYWKTQLPRLLADESLRTFWDGKTIDWFQQGLRAAKQCMTYYGLTPKEAIVWYVHGANLRKYYAMAFSASKAISSRYSIEGRGGFVVLGNGSKVPVLGTHKDLLYFFGTSVLGLKIDELKALFKKVNDKFLLNAANTAAKQALEAFLREQRSGNIIFGTIGRIRTWGISSKIHTLLTGVVSQEDLLAQLTNAITTASGSYQLCLERMRSAAEVREKRGHPRRDLAKVVAVGGTAAGTSCDEATTADADGAVAATRPDDACMQVPPGADSYDARPSADITRVTPSMTFFPSAEAIPATRTVEEDGGALEQKGEATDESDRASERKEKPITTHAARP